jgi:hypothetical protein
VVKEGKDRGTIYYKEYDLSKPIDNIEIPTNEKDLNDFSKLINQPLNNKTKSIWFPKLIRGINSNKRYIDES